MTAMMKCGHSANAIDERGNPVCAICFGIVAGAIVRAEAPDLTGRIAECMYHVEANDQVLPVSHSLNTDQIKRSTCTIAVVLAGIRNA